ncbi:GNAT family N-acetyltransferase [Shewanella algae]|uniref:GNAT family N-acetyltransferase n=1 Tax=Shewanella algae TaxID=38313 RepID=UPI00373521E4
MKTRRQLPIGILGLSRYGRVGEIGILLRPQAQGQGYAKELLHLMQQRLSSEATLDELLLRTHKKNEPMKKSPWLWGLSQSWPSLSTPA